MKSNKRTNLIMNLALTLTLGVLTVVSPSYGEKVAMENESGTVYACLNNTIKTQAIPKIEEIVKTETEKAEKEAASAAAEESVEYSYDSNYTASNATYPSTSYTYSDNGALTPQKGVVYYGGHRETYYSQKVLPGGGLNIPGRHVASDGTVRDADGYICVASSDYAKGTVVETSLGTAKVYDTGCASGTVDIYTNW